MMIWRKLQKWMMKWTRAKFYLTIKLEIYIRQESKWGGDKLQFDFEPSSGVS